MINKMGIELGEVCGSSAIVNLFWVGKQVQNHLFWQKNQIVQLLFLFQLPQVWYFIIVRGHQGSFSLFNGTSLRETLVSTRILQGGTKAWPGSSSRQLSLLPCLLEVSGIIILIYLKEHRCFMFFKTKFLFPDKMIFCYENVFFSNHRKPFTRLYLYHSKFQILLINRVLPQTYL